MTRVIGPSRSRRRRWWYVGATLAAAAVFMVFFVASSGAVTGSPSNFESQDALNNANPPVPDGNMTNDVAGNSDWNCFANGGSSNTTGFVTSGITVGSTCSSALVKTNAVAKSDPAATTSDDSWVNGTKFDNSCEPVGTNKNPGKDDFTAVASYNETKSSNNHTFLYGATIRFTANGSASENVELNQVAGTSSCPITRTAGDHLLAFDYNSGGKVLNLHVLTWIDSSNPGTSDMLGGNNGTCIIKNDTMPCWGANVITPATASFDGDTNTSPIDAGKNGINGQALVAGQFAEFGVDLTSALNQNPNACNTTSQIDWESRSSGSSFSSNPEDIAIETQPISNCGRIIIHKQTSPRGVNKAFPFDSTLPNPTGIVTTSSSPYCQGDTTPGGTPGFSLNDNGITSGNGAANTEDCMNVLKGSYTVTEETQSGFVLSGIICTTPTGGTSTVTYGSASHSSFTAGDTVANINLAAGETVECTYTNTQNTATLATSVTSGSPFTPGTQVRDTATVTGSQSSITPNGSVTFYMCHFAPASTSVCDGTTTDADGSTGVQLNSTPTAVSGSGATASANSPFVNSGTPLAPGRYCFRAVYSGDTNYPGTLTEWGGTSGATECFTVSKVNSSTVTTPSTSSIALADINGGSTVTDTAVVSPNPTDVGQITGSVNFFICGPIASGTCDGTTNVGTAVTGNAKTLGTVSPPCPTLGLHAACAVSGQVGSGFIKSVGRYCFRGEYGGDTKYNPSSDSSSSECFTVTDSSTVTTSQSWRPQDTAEIKSAGGTALTGTVTFTLFDNATCTAGTGSVHAIYTTGPLDITTNGTGASNDRTLSTSQSSVTITSTNSTGAYSWQVVYSGDGASGNTSSCESTTMTINDNH